MDMAWIEIPLQKDTSSIQIWILNTDGRNCIEEYRSVEQNKTNLSYQKDGKLAYNWLIGIQI